ncbi:MAG: hypothetical protein QM401_00790 [Bacillota bacterium]|nr:hypothetical protein [Bacillota bacterium]
MTSRKIQQIIPAINWWAVYEVEDEVEPWILPLVCWARVETVQGNIQVEGMVGDAGTDFAVGTGFVGYVYAPHREGAKQQAYDEYGGLLMKTDRRKK